MDYQLKLTGQGTKWIKNCTDYLATKFHIKIEKLLIPDSLKTNEMMKEIRGKPMSVTDQKSEQTKKI